MLGLNGPRLEAGSMASLVRLGLVRARYSEARARLGRFQTQKLLSTTDLVFGIQTVSGLS